jgi:hypothetical protein
VKTEDIHPPNSGDKNAEIQMFEKSLRIFVTDTKRMCIFANREEILRKPLQVFIKMNCEKATQMEKPKACGLSKAGLVYYFPFKQNLFVVIVDKYVFHPQQL